MTGSEKTGIENADICLLENAYYILTPTAKTDEKRLAEFKDFVESLDSIPLILDYEQHDQATAAVSHLPHMISYALVHLVKNIDDEKESSTIMELVIYENDSSHLSEELSTIANQNWWKTGAFE